ncbi:MAG: DUF4280 domain-containing protein [Defluviitaleaceae bacterium]|nr:DUF4280 domain-containing protein [Defluviitaleaceae bacterium]
MAEETEESFVVAGAVIHCHCGSHMRQLDAPYCHGTYLLGKPALNVADSVPGDNIPSFGVCLSEENPHEVVKTSQEDMMFPFECGVELPLKGRRCIPELYGKWEDGKEDVLVEGEPALTTESILTCGHGGVIYFINDGQEVD